MSSYKPVIKKVETFKNVWLFCGSVNLKSLKDEKFYTKLFFPFKKKWRTLGSHQKRLSNHICHHIWHLFRHIWHLFRHIWHLFRHIWHLFRHICRRKRTWQRIEIVQKFDEEQKIDFALFKILVFQRQFGLPTLRLVSNFPHENRLWCRTVSL